jgi:hypothetical protein
MSACKAEFDELLKQKVARVLRETQLDGALQLVLTNRKGVLTR